MTSELKDLLAPLMPAIHDYVNDPGLRDRLTRLATPLDTSRHGSVQSGAGSAADDDRVVATVDGTGTLTAIEISPAGYRDLDATALAAACTQALDNAREKLAIQLRSLLDELTAEIIGDRPVPELPRVADVDDLLRQAREVAELWT